MFLASTSDTPSSSRKPTISTAIVMTMEYPKARCGWGIVVMVTRAIDAGFSFCMCYVYGVLMDEDDLQRAIR